MAALVGPPLSDTIVAGNRTCRLGCFCLEHCATNALRKPTMQLMCQLRDVLLHLQLLIQSLLHVLLISVTFFSFLCSLCGFSDRLGMLSIPFTSMDKIDKAIGVSSFEGSATPKATTTDMLIRLCAQFLRPVVESNTNRSFSVYQFCSSSAPSPSPYSAFSNMHQELYHMPTRATVCGKPHKQGMCLLLACRNASKQYPLPI